ncbi:MAG: hypothetical protein KTR16_07125 [Acidiferrobacterales bacterium]|nr:hypothetical protein [Acidiferrobacterales bacterium]
MSFESMLAVIDDHESNIALTSDYLNESNRRLLSDSFEVAKRVIQNSSVISFTSYFDALSTISSHRFDKAYSRYAVNYDLEHSDSSLCYVIFTKAYSELDDMDSNSRYEECLHKCVHEIDGEPALNSKVFASKYVAKWLDRMRPEQKIFLITAFNDDDLIERFDLQLLQNSSHDLIELSTHILMSAAFVASLVNDEDIYSPEKLIELCEHHSSVLIHLSASANSILAKTGIAALKQEDIPAISKSIKDSSIAHARSKRKIVIAEIRDEWRQFAYDNWHDLQKPRNQVGDMVERIQSNVESARDFSTDAIRDNIKGIKKQALARK